MSNRNIKRSGRMSKPDEAILKPAKDKDGNRLMDGKAQVFQPYVRLRSNADGTDSRTTRQITLHPTKGYRSRRVA